jgi:hypothetical protein
MNQNTVIYIYISQENQQSNKASNDNKHKM